MLPETFHTARLKLRPIVPEDAGPIFDGYAQDTTVTRFVIWRPHRSRSDTEAYIAQCIATPPDVSRPFDRDAPAKFRFASDSLLEGDGFELPVPEREDRVSSLGLLLAKDRGVGADVSVQPGFVIIMPSPREASGAPLVVLPWTLRMTSATNCPQSERYVGHKDANIWSGQERRDHGKLVDALWVRKYLNKTRFLTGLWCSVVEPELRSSAAALWESSNPHSA